uniref:Ovule protein n=1 Tax=Mesocestoides corti TaxID=53468 RepID=A0A5K3FPR3_MESCO
PDWLPVGSRDFQGHERDICTTITWYTWPHLSPCCVSHPAWILRQHLLWVWTSCSPISGFRPARDQFLFWGGGGKKRKLIDLQVSGQNWWF